MMYFAAIVTSLSAKELERNSIQTIFYNKMMRYNCGCKISVFSGIFLSASFSATEFYKIFFLVSVAYTLPYDRMALSLKFVNGIEIE